MNRWSDQTAFPNLPASEVAGDDYLPIADASLAVGSRQRNITIDTLSAGIRGNTPRNIYDDDHTINLDDDLGAHGRMIVAGTFTFPEDLTPGAGGTLANATVSDTVDIVGAGTVTLLAAGSQIANGKWVAWLVVAPNVIEVVGAFADDPNTSGVGPVEVELGFPGAPDAGAIDRILIGRDCRLEVTGASIAALNGVNPDTTLEVDILKNGTSIGDIEVTDAGVVTLTIDADTDFDAGDFLELEAPNPADPDFAGLYAYFTLAPR